MITPNTRKLLLDDYPLVLLPSLATHIGLNEALVLQQLHYWILKNGEKADHWHDEKCWCYNSYTEWQEKNFPFFSVDTIERAFRRLRDRWRLVIVGNFNKMKADRTLWYTIDYDAVDALANSVQPLAAKCVNGKGKMRQPLPETIYRDYLGAGGSNGERFTPIETYREHGWEYMVMRRPQRGIVAKEMRRKAGDVYDTDLRLENASVSGKDALVPIQASSSSTNDRDSNRLGTGAVLSVRPQESDCEPRRSGEAPSEALTESPVLLADALDRVRPMDWSQDNGGLHPVSRTARRARHKRVARQSISSTASSNNRCIGEAADSDSLTAEHRAKYARFVRQWALDHPMPT